MKATSITTDQNTTSAAPSPLGHQPQNKAGGRLPAVVTLLTEAVRSPFKGGSLAARHERRHCLVLIAIAASCLISSTPSLQAAGNAYQVDRVEVIEWTGKEKVLATLKPSNDSDYRIINQPKSYERTIYYVNVKTFKVTAYCQKRRNSSSAWYNTRTIVYDLRALPSTWRDGQQAQVGGKVSLWVAANVLGSYAANMSMGMSNASLLSPTETLQPGAKQPFANFTSGDEVATPYIYQSKSASVAGYVKVQLDSANRQSWFVDFKLRGQQVLILRYHYTAAKTVKPWEPLLEKSTEHYNYWSKQGYEYYARAYYYYFLYQA